jgi:asparagine synthase (glutamine-hydrolysing)
MFAFVIWDPRARRLFIARDRFGEKPLYYSVQHRLFAFGSELSALIQHPRVDRTLDHKTLQKFFAYGYIPAPNAIYRGAKKLPAGCHLTLDLRDTNITVERYWQFVIEAEEDAPAGRDGVLAEELKELLDRAVARRMVSDAPLGILLSGGIDSSTVLALAARHRPAESLDTFTIGFTERSFDESVFAREMAAYVGSRHHEKILELDIARDLLDTVLGGLDEPLGDPSILPTYLLAAFARQSVTVALTGDGGDELFAGYDPISALQPAALYNRLVPKPIHLLLRRMSNLLPRSSGNMRYDFKVRRALAGLSYSEQLWNPVWMAPLEPALIASLFEEPIRVEQIYSEAIETWDASKSRNPLDRTLEFFTTLYLQDDILTKVDRASMMVSLESRAAMLDNDVVEFCRRLPHGYKFRDGQRKYLLKKAISGLLPKRLLRRRKKGFGIPVYRWLKEIPAEVPLDPVPSIRIRWVADRWRAFRSGSADDRIFLWSWLSMQNVLRRSALVDS